MSGGINADDEDKAAFECCCKLNRRGWGVSGCTRRLGSIASPGKAGTTLGQSQNLRSDWSTSVKNLRADPFAFVFALGRSAFTNACVSD